jgi:hypothetical protein
MAINFFIGMNNTDSEIDSIVDYCVESNIDEMSHQSMADEPQRKCYTLSLIFHIPTQNSCTS